MRAEGPARYRETSSTGGVHIGVSLAKKGTAVSPKPGALGFASALAEVGILMVIMTLSFRLVTIPLLTFYIVLLVFWRYHRNNVLLISVGLLAAVSAIQPVDMGFTGYPLGKRFGNRKPGLHLAPFVTGMPNRASLRQNYGDYFCGDTFWIAPEWILTWN